MTINNMNEFRTKGLYAYNPDANPEEALTSSVNSELPNSISSQNVVILPAASKEEITAEGPDDSGIDTEDLPLSLLLKTSQNAKVPRTAENQMENCEIHKFLPTPTF